MVSLIGVAVRAKLESCVKLCDAVKVNGSAYAAMLPQAAAATEVNRTKFKVKRATDTSASQYALRSNTIKRTVRMMICKSSPNDQLRRYSRSYSTRACILSMVSVSPR